MATVLEGIPFSIDRDLLAAALREPPGSREVGRVEEMARQAEAAGSPSAVYRASRLTRVRADGVDLDGIPLDGPLLTEKLAGLQTAFPFIATCGARMEEWAGSYSDMLDRYRADVIATIALGSAVESLKKHIRELHDTGSLSMMNPGSLGAWPLEEQRKIFALLGDSAARIGVALTDSLLMKPLKSLSGILFASDEEFVNCGRCPRADCPARRAPFDGHAGTTRGCGGR